MQAEEKSQFKTQHSRVPVDKAWTHDPTWLAQDHQSGSIVCWPRITDIAARPSPCGQGAKREKCQCTSGLHGSKTQRAQCQRHVGLTWQVPSQGTSDLQDLVDTRKPRSEKRANRIN